jgi:hypothetical protein
VADEALRIEEQRGSWRLVGSAADRFGLVNEFLGHLADRNY